MRGNMAFDSIQFTALKLGVSIILINLINNLIKFHFKQCSERIFLLSRRIGRFNKSMSNSLMYTFYLFLSTLWPVQQTRQMGKSEIQRNIKYIECKTYIIDNNRLIYNNIICFHCVHKIFRTKI